MDLKVWSLIGIVCALTGCGAEDTGGGTPLPQARPGEQVDLDGDGTFDGVAIDIDMDGIADGVDTNNDGVIDAELPAEGDTTAGGNPGATTAGDNGGAAPGNNGSSEGGDNNCEELTARAMPTTPDMLIVLDRSGSMSQGGRWDPSVSAVKSITGALDDKIRFGLMTFPGVSMPAGGGMMCAPDDFICQITMGGGIGLGDACGAGTVNVPVDLNKGPDIATFLDATQPNGGTPTGPSLEAALDALGSQAAGPDEIVAPKFVLLVSDGQPTCPSGNGMNVNQADITQSNDAIDALLEGGAKTYVIGYDTKNDASLASVLDEFAVHGGTGSHRAVEDEASLLAEFQKIAGEVVSCSYQLDTAPTDPSYVLVTLDDKQLNLDQPDGWSINGKAVTLQGQACKTLQDGKDHLLNVQVKCEVVPIL